MSFARNENARVVDRDRRLSACDTASMEPSRTGAGTGAGTASRRCSVLQHRT